MQAWRNERQAPSLLPHQFELVDAVNDQLSNMHQNLHTASHSLRHRAYAVELDRLRFVLADYIRARLEKIERMAHAILAEERQRRVPFLSAEERTFALGYAQLYEQHMDAAVLGQMPPPTRKVDYAAICERCCSIQ